MKTEHQQLTQLQLYRTGEYPCNYLPEHTASSQMVAPIDRINDTNYGPLLDLGFRRSGLYVYRPQCAGCHACQSYRVLTEAFTPNRSQRRCLARNADVDARIVAPVRSDEHLALYRKYLASRHAGGGMDDHGALEFEQFLIGAWSESRFLELREHRTHALLAVAVTDLAADALSAVYTFYDPDHATRGLGTLGVLRQVEWARRDGRSHLYLGYWIAGHPKMDYKRRFQPLEGFDGRGWRRLQA